MSANLYIILRDGDEPHPKRVVGARFWTEKGEADKEAAKMQERLQIPFSVIPASLEFLHAR